MPFDPRTEPPSVLPPPGPAPQPPAIPWARLTAVRDAIEHLVRTADATRRRHEEAVRTLTDVDHFEGAAATTFRTQLVGQLRRLHSMVADLEADLDVLAAARVVAHELEEAHADAMRAHRAAMSAHRASVDANQRWWLERGAGPRDPSVGASSPGGAWSGAGRMDPW